jgi:hypothetical protein
VLEDAITSWEPAFGFGMNAAAADRSRALFTGADNLLVKAERALAVDEDRARSLVRRALALGHDPHEDAVPALSMATYRLFAAVVDAAEESPADDQRWLDLVERHLLGVEAEVDGLVGDAVVEVMAGLSDDGHLHDLQDDERRRLWRLVMDARRRRGLGEVAEGQVEEMVPQGEREEFVLGLLRVTRTYREQVARTPVAETGGDALRRL